MKTIVGVLPIMLAGGFSGLALSLPSVASAASCEATLNGGSNSVWRTEVNGSFIDAELSASGGKPFRGDAFDRYTRAQVGAFQYENFDPAGCEKEGKHELAYPSRVVDNNPDIAMLATPKLYVSPNRSFARILLVLEAPGQDPVLNFFGWFGDLGSDSLTAIGTTSSGNAKMTREDRWATSCEDLAGNGCAVAPGEEGRDVELAYVWEGPGARLSTANGSVTSAEPNGKPTAYPQAAAVKPGKPLVLMSVVALSRTIGNANRTARKISRDPKEYGVFKGMSKAEIKRLRNWDPDDA